MKVVQVVSDSTCPDHYESSASKFNYSKGNITINDDFDEGCECDEDKQNNNDNHHNTVGIPFSVFALRFILFLVLSGRSVISGR